MEPLNQNEWEHYKNWEFHHNRRLGEGSVGAGILAGFFVIAGGLIAWKIPGLINIAYILFALAFIFALISSASGRNRNNPNNFPNSH